MPTWRRRDQAIPQGRRGPRSGPDGRCDMRHDARILALAAALLLALASPAAAGIPSPVNSTASSASGCFNIRPDGGGNTLANVGLTIAVHVEDAGGVAIPGYPFQDIWWDDAGNGDIALCQGGTVAAANTNGTGDTTITGAGAGGGWTQSGLRVYLAGVPITGTPSLLIDVNSPDLNGDITVNLADVGDFSIDFNNVVYDFRSDFTCDGFENLADVGDLAIANAGVCP